MSNKPHRPFVPNHTPPERPAPRSTPDFRVARPFVHGQARSYKAEATNVAEPEQLGSIATFLAMDTPAPMSDFVAMDTPAPIAESPGSITDYLADVAFNSVPDDAESDYELPPIEHFTDTISEEDAADPNAYSDSFMDPFANATPEPQADPSGWEETDWQRYDWRAAGALGDAGDPAASSAWAQTDWGNPGSSARDSRDSAARAIADALDGIARRIRDGDLVVPPQPAAVPDPVTIAATLAALLGVRR